MNNCAYYIDYPVPALLYDAERGNTHSRLVIFDYFAALAERKQDIPPEIAIFIGKQLRSVIDGKQSPAKMFNPEGTKNKGYNPLVSDMLNLTDPTGDIKAKFEAIAEHPFIDSSPGTVDRQYYAHKAYTERLSAIQFLLDERQNCTDHTRAHEISSELNRLTAVS